MAELPALSISPEKAYFIVAKARQFDAKDGVTDPDSGSNASDDGMRSVLEDRIDDPVRTELVSFIHDLNDDERPEPTRFRFKRTPASLCFALRSLMQANFCFVLSSTGDHARLHSV
jgi:hypothetical protein